MLITACSSFSNVIIHSTEETQSRRYPGLDPERWRVLWLSPSKALKHIFTVRVIEFLSGEVLKEST